MREWDMKLHGEELAAFKAEFDRPENRIVRADGTAVCRRCGLRWEDLVHGC